MIIYEGKYLLAELTIITNSLYRLYCAVLAPFFVVTCGLVSVVSREVACCNTKGPWFQTWQLETATSRQKCEDLVIIRIAQLTVFSKVAISLKENVFSFLKI